MLFQYNLFKAMTLMSVMQQVKFFDFTEIIENVMMSSAKKIILIMNFNLKLFFKLESFIKDLH